MGTGQSINDHIIGQSFRREMTEDIELEATTSKTAAFTIDPQDVEAEFSTLPQDKPKTKKKILIVSLAAVATLSTVFFILQLSSPASLLKKDAVGVQNQANSGVPAPIAQVPASLGSLGEKAPASLGAPEQKAEGTTAVPNPAQISATTNSAPLPVVLPGSAPQPVMPTAATPSTAQPQQAPSQVPAAAPTTSVVSVPSSLAAPVEAAPAPQQAIQTPVQSTPQDVVKQPTPPAAAVPVQEVKKSAAAEKPKADTPAKEKAKSEAPKAEKAVAKALSESQKQKAEKPSAAPEKKKQEVVEANADAKLESVKPLVTFTAGQLGVRSFSPDTLILLSSKTNAPVRYRVGDTLPNGDVIEHLDSTSMTVVTNRKVIRISN